MQFKNNRLTTFTEEFGQATVMINLVAIAQFFKAIYIGIFKSFLAIKSIKADFLEPVSIYFETVETNG